MSQAELSCSGGSIQPVRSDQPGGRRIATWLRSCTASHTEFEKCAGLPGTGPWTFSAPLWPLEYPQRCDRGGLVELRARWAFAEFVWAPVLSVNVGADGNLSSSWNASVSGNGSVTAGLNDGSPLTIAFQSEMKHGAAAFWTLLGVFVKLLRLFYVCERGYIVFYYCKLCAYLYSLRPT